MTSTCFRFTARAIDQLRARAEKGGARADEYSDRTIPGLKIQVTSQGHKSWYFRYTFAGCKRAIRIGTYPAISVEEARQRALELRAILDRGLDPQEERDRQKAMPTFAEFALKEYMPHALEWKRSAEDDEAKLRLHLIPEFGARRLCDIGRRDVEIYLGRIKGKLSPASANRHLALLNRAYNLGIQWGRVEKNPCKGIKKFKEPRGGERFLSPDEIRRVVEAAGKDSNFYASTGLVFLLYSGLRREEAFQALWQHVDLENGTLFLPKTKSGTTRHVVLNHAARKLLAELPRIEGSPWVFPGRDPAKPVHNPRKCWLRILKAAGVEACRIHDTRHTFAATLVQQGASLFQVQQLLGHASPVMTMRYPHFAPETLRGVSDLMANVVAKA